MGWAPTSTTAAAAPDSLTWDRADARSTPFHDHLSQKLAPRSPAGPPSEETTSGSRRVGSFLETRPPKPATSARAL